MSWRRGGLHLMAMVAMLSFGLAGCGNPNQGDSVAIIGDSITDFDQTDLNDQLGDDYHLVISGNFGYTITDVEPEAKFVGGRDHDQVIFNIGTNDVLVDAKVDDSIAILKKEIGYYDSSRCVFLVNINEHMINHRTGQATTDEAKRFNAAFEKLAAEDPRISIIDWNAEASSTLNGKKPPFSTLTADSVHPTEEGNRKLNDLYARALEGC